MYTVNSVAHSLQVLSANRNRTCVSSLVTEYCFPLVSIMGMVVSFVCRVCILGSPLVKLVRLRAANVAKRVARPFSLLQKATENVAQGV